MYKITKNPLIFLSSTWVFILLAIAAWWIYLFFNITHIPNHFADERFTNMIKWEGSVFILLLLLISTSLFIYIYKDQEKTKSMQIFFASLTHELKTPLASIKLQSEVIKDLNQNSQDSTSKNIDPYMNRLIEDVVNLENHMDKILQLSRIERGGNLNLTSIPLNEFLINMQKETHFALELSPNTKILIEDLNIFADEFAIKLIFRNLIENSKIHAKVLSAKLFITISGQQLKISYQDGGVFHGDSNKIGTLFYKHQSSKGSGIGLFLIKKLMKKMNGELKIENHKSIHFGLLFNKAEGIV